MNYKKDNIYIEYIEDLDKIINQLENNLEKLKKLKETYKKLKTNNV